MLFVKRRMADITRRFHLTTGPGHLVVQTQHFTDALLAGTCGPF